MYLSPADQTTLVGGLAAIFSIVVAHLLALWFPAIKNAVKQSPLA